ncbi:hypothetical protein BH11PSE2_BH11PSE2_13020 [soil metagenome]
MLDLTAEMGQLWASLGAFASAPTPGHGRVLQFVSAHSGEGTSTVAREFARYAAARAKRPVWLVDLDLPLADQYGAIAHQRQRFGAVGAQAAASPDSSTFFTVQPPARGKDGRAVPDIHYLVAHPVGGARLWVTRFRREKMRPNQTVHVIPGGAYWSALRSHAELIILDAPATDRSNTALTLAPYVDASVLVLSADAGDAGGPSALKAAITGGGGRCAGVFVNRVTVEAPGFLRSVLR